jgi:hypothetical protein
MEDAVEAQFLCPPMLGTYINENAKEGDSPVKPCLIIAWDDHSENYLIADRETGEQSWKSISVIAIDGDSVIASYGIGDTHAPSCGTSSSEDSDDENVDRCPVCKQPTPD